MSKKNKEFTILDFIIYFTLGLIFWHYVIKYW